jgi:hypothetical protein
MLLLDCYILQLQTSYDVHCAIFFGACPIYLHSDWPAKAAFYLDWLAKSGVIGACEERRVKSTRKAIAHHLKSTEQHMS